MNNLPFSVLNRRQAALGLALVIGSGPGCATTPRGRHAALDLSGLEARHGGRLGVAALEEGTGRTIGWREGERFAYCSTFKLFLAAAVLERTQNGLDRRDRRIPVTEADIVPHGPVTHAALGRTLTLEELCAATVRTSDNTAGNILIRELGGLSVFQQWYRSIGDTTTRVDRWEIELNTAFAGDPRDTCLPEQAVRNVETIRAGGRWTADTLATLTGWLETPVGGAGRIVAGTPDGWRVAHKTGTGPDGPANDLGFCRPADGGPAVLVGVYFTECPGLTADQRDGVLADATRAVFAALAGTAGR